MFQKESFSVFQIEGLEPRMKAIRSGIQPIFQEIGLTLQGQLEKAFPEQNFYLHIAQHRRRTTYAPDSTWCALSTQKRGYKMEPCFTLGIREGYVFLYLSVIDQPKNQVEYAEIMLENQNLMQGDFVLSKDHTKAEPFDQSHLTEFLTRLKNVKKSDFEIGRIWQKAEFEEENDDFLAEMQEILTQLLPVYKKLMQF